MRRSIVWVTAVLCFGGLFAFLKKEPRPLADSRLSAIDSYRYGESVNRGDDRRSTLYRCDHLSQPQLFFCEEGVGSGVWRQQKGAVPLRLQAWFSIFQKPSIFHVLGLGMGMSDTEIWRPHVLREIRRYVAENTIAGIVHAWSFGRGMLFGLGIEVLNEECSYFSDKALRDACYFGIGRTIYFRNSGQTIEGLTVLSSSQDIRLIWMGYGFAGVFTVDSRGKSIVPLPVGADGQTVEALQRGALIADLFREVLRGESIDKRNDAKIQLRQCVLRCRDEGISITACLY